MIGINIVENVEIVEITLKSVRSIFLGQDLEFNQLKVNLNPLTLVIIKEDKLESQQDKSLGFLFA